MSADTVENYNISVLDSRSDLDRFSSPTKFLKYGFLQFDVVSVSISLFGPLIFTM